jgi:hypothetical protein
MELLIVTRAALRHLLQGSSQGYLSKVSQFVACNRLNSVKERIARWLLITHDRVGANEFTLTHNCGCHAGCASAQREFDGRDIPRPA